MKKTIILLMCITFISKVIGFGRDIILSFFYGASSISDIYLISLTIPTVIFALIGKGISAGFIPLYTKIELEEGGERANQFTSNVITIVIVLCTIIFVCCYFYAEPIVKLFASGFKGETLQLTVNFTRITLIGVYFTGLIYVYSSFLQIKGIHNIPTIMGLPANIIAIISIALSYYTNIYVLAVGGVLAVVSQYLLLRIFVQKSRYKFKPNFRVKDQYVIKMVVLALPVILGSSVTQINLLIDRTLASKIVEGGITALTYASTLSVVIIGIFVLSLSSVFYPNISKLAAENKYAELNSLLSRAVSAINVIVIPITFMLCIFAEPIIKMLYGRGSFDEEALFMTSSALFFYAIGIVGLGQREILMNAFYSLHDTKTPMNNAAIAMVLNIILNFILSRYLGIGGLALATSISSIICSLLMFHKLQKRLSGMELKLICVSMMKIVVASSVMGVCSKYIYAITSRFWIDFTALLAAGCIGLFIYCGIIYLLKLSEIDEVLEELRVKLLLWKKQRNGGNGE